MKTIYLVRHGQAVGNEIAVFKKPSALLNERGVLEASVLSQKLMLLEPELIVSSPLPRAMQTSEIINQETSIPFIIHEGFSGIRHATSMAGKLKEGDEANQYLKTIKRMYTDNPDSHYEDAENYTEFHARLCTALQFLEQRSESKIAVVTHESIIKSLLILVLHNKAYNPVLNIDLKNHMGKMLNTGITKFEYTDTWKLVSWNVN